MWEVTGLNTSEGSAKILRSLVTSIHVLLPVHRVLNYDHSFIHKTKIQAWLDGLFLPNFFVCFRHSEAEYQTELHCVLVDDPMRSVKNYQCRPILKLLLVLELVITAVCEVFSLSDL